MKNEKEFYMKVAQLVAEQSYCERAKVGAVIVKDNNIISFGYNGTPRGFDNTCEVYYPATDNSNAVTITKPEVLHAESNAILKCALSGSSTNGSTLFTTDSPCIDCAKLIIQAGVKEVYYKKEYRDHSGLLLLTQANINVQKI